MSRKNVQRIIVGETENNTYYEVYEHNDHFFYKFNHPGENNSEYKQLEEGVDFSDPVKAWIKEGSDKVDNLDGLLSDILTQIRLDQDQRRQKLQAKIAEKHAAFFLKTANVSNVENRFRRSERPNTQGPTSASTNSSVEVLETDSIASSISENSTGSSDEASDSQISHNVIECDKATQSSSSSVTTNSMMGSDVEERMSDNQSSTRSTVQRSSINSMGVEPDSTAVITPPPSPTVPTVDLSALYSDLQEIVAILAQLKGEQPQLENVRKALSAAIEKTGGKVSPRPEATVEPPNVGVAGAETSPTPKADDIEENIKLLKEVEDKLANLLATHGDTMGEELRDALTELQNAVKQSISAQTTQKFRRDKAGVQSEQQQISTTPMGDSTPNNKKENQSDDDMTHGSNSTPSV